MKPKLQDIASETGFSVATVSRALQSDKNSVVSLETRERVHRVARSLGYQPNLLGRSLKTGRSHTVSYWTYDAFSPYYVGVAKQLCALGAERGYVVAINNSFDAAQLLEATSGGFDNPFAAHFDGTIACCDVSFANTDFAQSLRLRRAPWVGINTSYPSDLDFAGIDFYGGGRQVMSHLLEGGCRRIAMLIGGGPTHRYDPRARAYSDAMHEAGLELEWIELAKHRRGPARERMAAYAREHRALGRALPDAIFCVNDESAIGCYRGLCDADINVPNEVRLVGCDGIEDTAFHACPISTLEMPVLEMCLSAWDFLENRIRDRDLPQQQALFSPHLVIRESSQF